MNMTKHQLLNQLDQFTGTEHYYPLWPKVLLTDGTKYLAETVGCYWLMDAIASHVLHLPNSEGFTSCSLTCTNGSGNLVITDGNGNTPQRHDVGVHALVVHDNERGQDA